MADVGSVGRVTVYRLKAGDKQARRLAFPGFEVVRDTDATGGETEIPYKLFFSKPQPLLDPSWLDLFSPVLKDLPNLHVPQVAFAGFVLLAKVGKGWYAVCGGNGHFVVRKHAPVERRFGIMVAQRILSIAELTGLVQKDTAGGVLYLNRVFRGYHDPAGELANLKRILTHVRGKLEKESSARDLIGRSMIAGDSLSVSGKKTFDDILRFLVEVEKAWTRGAVKLRIPQLQPIHRRYEKELLADLEAELIGVIAAYEVGSTASLFLDNGDIEYLPDQVESYEVRLGRRRFSCATYEDVFVRAGSLLREEGNAAERSRRFDRLKLRVMFQDGSDELGAFGDYVCGDITHKHELYFLNNQLWYIASSDFLKQLDEELDNIAFIEPQQLKLIRWDPARHRGMTAENIYNRDHVRLVVLDRLKIAVPHHKGPVEFCDLLNLEPARADLVHVKHARGAGLRVLFSQGAVSSLLYSSSEEFRKKVWDADFDGKPNARLKKNLSKLKRMPHKSDLRIVFAIYDDAPLHKATSEESRLTHRLNGTLTAYAKIDLYHRVEDIRRLGFSVGVTRIEPYSRAAQKGAK